MEKIIKELEDLKKQYEELVREYENRGVENLGIEETEYYGAYLGKVELCEYLLNKFK